MGGVVDGGVGIGVRTSPRRAAIEKAQAKLRQEYDVLEERRRELEFLEKGGNPLDFKFGNASSLSVQSTSVIDQQAEHVVTSEAKGSFALPPSTQGDSFECSDSPGIPAVCEPNSADNLLLFADENELQEGERISKCSRKRSSVIPSELSYRMGTTQNAKESEDSAIFDPYRGRNKSKINRDWARSSSADVIHGCGGDSFSLPARGLMKDARGSISEANNEKSETIPYFPSTKLATSNGNLSSKVVIYDNQSNMNLTGMQGAEVPGASKGDTFRHKLDIISSKNLADDPHHESPQTEAQQPSSALASEGPCLVGGKEQVVSSEVARIAENEPVSVQMKAFSHPIRDRKSVLNGQDSCAVIAANGLNSGSSSTQNTLILDVNNDNNSHVCPNNINFNGTSIGETSELRGMGNLDGDQMLNEKNESRSIENAVVLVDNNESAYQKDTMNDSTIKVEDDRRSEVQKENPSCPSAEGAQKSDSAAYEADVKASVSEIDRKDAVTLIDISSGKNLSANSPTGILDVTTCKFPKSNLSGRNSDAVTSPQPDSDNLLKLTDKADEDSILEEARIIEAKQKRIVELSATVVPSEDHQKSHWGFVLEEMAWLANDFAQERLWKMAAAAQICRMAAFTYQLRLGERNQQWKLRKIAFTMANSVMQFWCHAEGLLNSNVNVASESGCDLTVSCVADVGEISENKTGKIHMDASKDFEHQHLKKIAGLAIQGYAVRFLKHISSPFPPLQAVQPAIHEMTSDSGIMEISWDANLTEESLFYAVRLGAVESYRKSFESYFGQTERSGSILQEEVEISVFYASAEFAYRDDACDEDEEEKTAFFLPGDLEGSKSLKLNQKKRKNSMKSNVGADFPNGNCMVGSQQSMFMGKRPTSLNVSSIPIKRVRTGPRLRVLSPFGASVSMGDLPATKTDASSGDTNSFQDDHSTLNDGSKVHKGMEVESFRWFEKQLPYDYAETIARPKKKKKAEHLASAYDQNWQLESNNHSEQRDHSRKRLEDRHIDSTGTCGLNMQHNAKRPKMMKQCLDYTFEITPSGPILSPAPSQMSNMSTPNKFIKMIGSRDKGRKAKTLKISAGQPGPGGQWSLFEDQTLVVLVHDMGPNWELVSDAINSALQLKCVYRKPNECKERHRVLMDRSGDGADSADDSGSFHSYTLPGIPKGSARQLFQRLQGPVEEGTLKFHFEKIIMIGKKQHYLRTQNDKVEPKQIVPVHDSHVNALLQVFPNNPTEGIRTPLDLCDATLSSQDVLPLGFEVPLASGLAITTQGAVGSILPASTANSCPQGSSGMVISSSLSPSSPPSGSLRDDRYGVPRMPLPVNEQHRMQQYNPMLSGRNIQQPNLPVPGSMAGIDQGVCVLPGGNGAGVMGGIMPLSRCGFRGVASTSMMNSGGLNSSSLLDMPSPAPVNMNLGPGSGKGNSTLRPCDAMRMIKPGHNSEHQRQLMVPELCMQVRRGNPSFDGMNSAFPNQTSSPPVQTYSGHPQQQHPNAMSNAHHSPLQGSNHGIGLPQQAYAFRLAEERQMQQQRLMLQQQQFPATGALMQHVEQPQLPISAPLQSSSQIQSQTSVPPLTSSPMTPTSVQNQQKQHLPPHGLSRNPQSGVSGLSNQMGKQGQRQLQQQQSFQQSGRQHHKHRQQSQSQHQAKLLKGMGRENMPVYPNISGDASHLNGLSTPPVNQDAEKGETIMHLIEGQSLYSGPSMSPVEHSKPLISPRSSNHSQAQQQLYSGSTPSTSKPVQQMPSHFENFSQGQVTVVSSSYTSSAMRQIIMPAVVAPSHQHLQLQSQANQKPVNQSQSVVHRMLQQNGQVNSDPPTNARAKQPQSVQQPVNVVSQVGKLTTMAMSREGIDSPNGKSVVFSPQKSLEPVCDIGSGTPNTASQVGSIACSPITNSSAIDPGPSVSQGLGGTQVSGGFPHNYNVGGQWQQRQPQLQKFSTPNPPTSQPSYQSNEQFQQDQKLSPQQQLPLLEQTHSQAAEKG